MPRPDEPVLVVSKSILFDNGNDYFEGFRSSTDVDFIKRVSENRSYMKHA